jgi:hypothetical protein
MPPIYIAVNSAQKFVHEIVTNIRTRDTDAYLLKVWLVTLLLALAHIAWTLSIVTSSKRDIILHTGHCRYCTLRARRGTRDAH